MSIKKLGMLALLMAAAFQPYAQDKLAYFKGSYQDALNEAFRTKKAIMLDFSAHWCGPCQKLARETFSDVDVAVLANNEYIIFPVDVANFDGMAIAEKYQVEEYPTVLFLDFKGRYVSRMKGFYPPNYFVRALDKFSQKQGKKKISEDEDLSLLSSL